MKKATLLFALLLSLCTSSFAQSFFQFYFFGNGIRHDALMYIDEYDNVSVSVRFYDADFRKYVTVDQSATAIAGAGGIGIICYNPVYSKTKTRAYYTPDNFYIGYDTYGIMTMFNLDDEGVYSPVYGLKELSTQRDYAKALNIFASY
ncbi:MAG: hypothetical protein IPN33_08615 [Saprospiraceae bacterium]|nr:hypothetical protein [Saprospiraceae bacterium]